MPRIVGELVVAKRLGQKTGAGFYSYAKGSRGQDDPAFAALLEKCRTGSRTVGLEEIAERLFLPMLTEASRVLMEGIVREPGDVDMGPGFTSGMVPGIRLHPADFLAKKPAFGPLGGWAPGMVPRELPRNRTGRASSGAPPRATAAAA